jgi:hypothetical protein
MWQPNRPSRIPSDIGLNFIKNEYKGTSFSIHQKRKTKSTSQSKDQHWQLDALISGQLQDHTCCALCTQLIRKQLQYFSDKQVSLCTDPHFSIYHTGVNFKWEFCCNTAKKCECHIFYFIYITGSFRNLLVHRLLQTVIFLTVKNNPNELGNVFCLKYVSRTF